jgi:ketosteroid isomerase-like protein
VSYQGTQDAEADAAKEADVAAVKKAIRRWARSFSSNDADAVLGVWDETYPQILHQAEEFPDPIRGFGELEHYNRAMARLASDMRDQSVLDLEADVIGDAAWCYLRGTITFDIPGLPEPISGVARQTFILRRRDGEWKVIHYHESRETAGLREPLKEAHPRPDELVNPNGTEA